ncbi:amidase family protein [Nonlabens marinus]|uniref:Amidase family protein n=1 Tax=Nonlabens marinus S1-08 TaxID=1454201 RepID=W8W050_9FLAO|nr:amidase family protein [Nonlabens marinus]BAO55711.1 amidase family protein [Nonlabens marinus S1-08]
MRKLVLLFAFSLSFLACKTSETTSTTGSKAAEKDQPEQIDTLTPLELKVLDSKYITREDVFAGLEQQVLDFSTNSSNGTRTVELLNKLVLEKSIPEIQKAIYDGKFTYEELSLYYLNRIYKYDRNNDLSLNSVIALNPKVLEQAREADARLEKMKENGETLDPYSIVGMPILLKDNINTADIPTTAGAAVLIDNQTDDAQLVKNLKDAGAIILGKANLSEWAYFFCGDCPSGYSAVGGQTLSPYKRKYFDTGGSSSGSGVSVAANFAVAAVGSETSGSILSPASQNSVVGLKPTVGTISGQGVVPISSYLDTAGPMAKNVVDTAILLNAMRGADSDVLEKELIPKLKSYSLEGKRFGVFKNFLETPLYAAAIQDIKNQGAVIVELEPKEVRLNGFLKLLNADMKLDLPQYFKTAGNSKYSSWDVYQVMQENLKDSLRAMPYGQRLFQGIMDEPEMTDVEFAAFKAEMTQTAQEYLNGYFERYELDGILSINNYTAGVAAVGFFPAMTVPMGYDKDGKPYGLTFIAPSGKDRELLGWGAGYERVSKKRQMPTDYQK